MSGNAPSLRSLLRLAVGRLPSARAAALRQQLAEDPAAQRRWRRIRRAAALNRRTLESPCSSADPQTIARFLDGGMTAAEESAWELTCWEDDALLQEVVENAGALWNRLALPEPPSGLQERLLPLIDSVQETDGGQALQTPRVEPAEAPLVRPPPQTHPAARNARRSRNWTLLAAAASLLLVASLVAWFRGSDLLTAYRDGPPAVRDSLARVEPAPQPLPPLPLPVGPPPAPADGQAAANLPRPQIALDDRAPREPAPQATADEARRSALAQQAAPQPAVREDAGEATQLAQSTAGADADPDSSAVAGPREVAVSWKEIHGLAAVQPQAGSGWRGAESVSSLASGSTLVTLPGSWASARVDSLAELILDADTQMTLRSGSEPQTWEIDVDRGNVALVGLSARTAVTLCDESDQWRIAVGDQPADVGFEWSADHPQLIAIRGRVEVNGQPLRAGQSWSVNDRGEAGISASTGDAPWTRRLAQRMEMPEKARRQLLASRNLIGDLQRLAAGPSEVEARSGHACLAALQPDLHFVSAATAEDGRLRRDAVVWLLSLNPAQPRTRRIWQSFAEHSRDPQRYRALFRIAAATRAQRELEPGELRLLMESLRHDDLAARQLAAVLLEVRFGASDFQANADPATRARMAEQWERRVQAQGARPSNLRNRPAR